jgi:hypothetical protein
MTNTIEEWSVYAQDPYAPEMAMGYFTDHEPTKKELNDWIEWHDLQHYVISVNKVIK